MSASPGMLHPELLDQHDTDSIHRHGHRLDHAEGASKPLRSHREPQPRGAKIHGNRPVDQAEAAARFIAAPEVLCTSTAQPAQPPTAQAMYSSSDTWQGNECMRASVAVAVWLSIGTEIAHLLLTMRKMTGKERAPARFIAS